MKTTMMKCSAAFVLATGVLAGCHTDKPEGGSAKADAPLAKSPAATPAMTTASPTPPPPKSAPPAPVVTTPAVTAAPMTDKDMTHVVAEDEPYYMTSPAQGKPADGTLKAGTKVLVMMPRGSYSQVMTASGKRVYTSTAGLKPVGK